MRKITGKVVALLLWAGLLTTNHVYAESFVEPSLVSEPRSSVLVLPPINATKQGDASFKTYAYMTAEVGKKGYFVYAPEIVEETLRGQGYPSIATAADIPFDKLKKDFGTEIVMIVRILDWDIHDYMGIGQEAVIDLQVEAYDVLSHKLLFRNQRREISLQEKILFVVDAMNASELDKLIFFGSEKVIKPMPQGRHFERWGY